jgi:signal transduction histidine kinase
VRLYGRAGHRTAPGIALRFRIPAQRRGIELHTLLETDGILALGDIELIERVMGNLLENALRYTPEGGQVRTELLVAPTLILVRVVDTESGIEPQHSGPPPGVAPTRSATRDIKFLARTA